jgi:hypothetical protein
VIVLRGGVYRTGDLAFNRKITIQPYLNERPVIKGSKIANGWVKRGDYWVTEWDSLFPNDPPEWYNPKRHGPPCVYNDDLVIIDGEMCRPVGEPSELDPGKFYFDYAAGEVYICEDPAGKTVEITAYRYGFVRNHDETADAEGPALPGLNITSPESYIAYNDISMHGSVAVMTRMSHKTIFEHNTVSHSNWFNLIAYPAGIKVFNQSYIYTVRNNYFSEMPCEAVWFDVGHREGVGLKMEISHRTYIAGNVFEKANMWLCNSNSCLAYNNTMIDSRIDLWRNDRGHGNWNGNYSFNHAATGPGVEGYHGHHLANNVFAGRPRGGFYILIEENNHYDKNFHAEVLAHNLFLDEAEWIFNAQFQPWQQPSAKYASLARFREVFGDYEEGNVALEISQDKLFRSKSEGDYRLKNVPGIPDGMDLPESIADLLGWRTANSGLGAFAQTKQEMVGSGNVPFQESEGA